MTRFRRAVEEWRKIPDSQVGPGSWDLQAEMARVANLVLKDVVKAVDSYERTIAALKKQNSKLRRDRKHGRVE